MGSEVQGRPVRTYPEVGLPEVQHQAMLDKAEEVRGERRGGGSGSVEGMGLRGLSAHMQMRVEGSSRRKKPITPLTLALQELRPLGERYASRASSSSRVVVCEQASLLRCGRVVDSFVGPHAGERHTSLCPAASALKLAWNVRECPNLSHTSVVSDSELECVTLLSSQCEPSSVTARSSISHSILQWAAKVGVTSGHGCAVAASGAEG